MSKGIISQVLAEEKCRIQAAGGDASVYFTRSTGKGKKKQDNGKKCTHCKRKRHNISECHTLKHKQVEKASGSNSKPDTSTSGKALGKTSSKSTSKSSSSKASAKVAAADDSDSDKTIQVFMACTVTIDLPPAATNEVIECVYKTKAKLCQSNLSHGWLIDSGASCTMCSHCSWFTQFSPLSNHTKVILSDDSAILATGMGHVCIRKFARGKWISSVLQDILYVPDLHGNLLSVSHLACHGTEVRFADKHCHIYNKQKSLILKGALLNDLYIMHMKVNGPLAMKLAILDPQPNDAILLPTHALTSCLTTSTGSLDL
jgi:hypothetical protein